MPNRYWRVPGTDVAKMAFGNGSKPRGERRRVYRKKKQKLVSPFPTRRSVVILLFRRFSTSVTFVRADVPGVKDDGESPEKCRNRKRGVFENGNNNRPEINATNLSIK